MHNIDTYGLVLCPGGEPEIVKVTNLDRIYRLIGGEVCNVPYYKGVSINDDIRMIYIPKKKRVVSVAPLKSFRAPCLDYKGKTIHGLVVFLKMEGVEYVSITEKDIPEIMKNISPWTSEQIEASMWWER